MPVTDVRRAHPLPEPRVTEESPRVWCLLGHRAGDNNQVLALAEALGWGFEEKRVAYNALRLVPNRLVSRGAFALRADARDRLRPPWPDLVIGIGQRSVPVARWIQAQSGGQTRAVHIGWPRCDPAGLDLVVTTANYPVAPCPNVLTLPACMSRATAGRLRDEADRWRFLLERFPPPWFLLVLGGNSWPWRLSPRVAVETAEMLAARSVGRGGSVLAVSSRRTPPAVADAVHAALQRSQSPAALFRPDDSQGNAYLGLLALSDQVAVTGDSVAMLSDAISADKTLAVVPVECGHVSRAMLATLRACLPDPALGPDAQPIRTWLARRGITDWSRDVGRFWATARRQGLLGSLADPVRPELTPPARIAADWVKARLQCG